LETAFNVLIYSGLSVLCLGIAMERKADFFGFGAFMIPLWELGQVVSGSGVNNQLILTSAYDVGTASWHDYAVSAISAEVFLAFLIVLAAVWTIDFHTREGGRKP
jgi:hypothetical protein